MGAAFPEKPLRLRKGSCHFHFFFLSMLFVANIAIHLPLLLGVSLVMVAVSLVLHGWLLQQKLMVKQLQSQQSTLSSKTHKS